MGSVWPAYLMLSVDSSDSGSNDGTEIRQLGSDLYMQNQLSFPSLCYGCTSLLSMGFFFEKVLGKLNAVGHIRTEKLSFIFVREYRDSLFTDLWGNGAFSDAGNRIKLCPVGSGGLWDLCLWDGNASGT